ncbi:hypothetical protein ACSAZL_06710 [Methanosarcina sp. T3]
MPELKTVFGVKNSIYLKLRIVYLKGRPAQARVAQGKINEKNLSGTQA